jgi:hypothetical protein
MLRIASLVFICVLPAVAVPLGFVSGHCGSISISHTITSIEPLDPVRERCDDNAVAFASYNLPFASELVALREDESGFPLGTADVELTLRTDILYRMQVFRQVSPIYVAFCFDVAMETYGHGFGTASHSFGPWSIGTPCDLSHAVRVPGDEWVPFVSRTYLHAVRGAHVLLSGDVAVWDLAGEPITEGFSLSATGIPPVPEPSTGMQLLLALPTVALFRRKRAV